MNGLSFVVKESDFVSILEIEMVTYWEVHALEVAQLIPLFSVLLFSFRVMNTETAQRSTAQHAVLAVHGVIHYAQWVRPALCIHATYLSVSFRKTEAGGAHWRLPNATAHFFKFKALICLSTISFIFLRKLKRFQF